MKPAPMFALLLCAAALPAQQALEFAPAFRHYSTDQGLPDNWVYNIYQDKTGYIWVSTNNGVCRFNGYAFEQFPDTLYANETDVLTGAMAEDTRGRLWYVDFQSRVFYIENGAIHPYAYNAVIARQKGRTDFFHGLMVGGAGEELWLVSHTKGGVLHLWGAGQCEESPRPPSSVQMQVFERNGKAHYSTTGVLPDSTFFAVAFQSDSGTTLVSHLPFPTPKRGVGYFATKLSGGRWCLFYYNNLYLIQGGKLVWMRHADQQPQSIWEEPDGALLVGFLHGGLVRYRSLEAFRTDRAEGRFFPELSVSQVMRDREGGYWIGTQQEGIYYCPAWKSGNTVKTPFFDSQNIKALAADGKNTLFVGMENGRIFELRLETGQVKEITPASIVHLNSLCYDPASRTLAAAGQSSAFYQNDRWQWFGSFVNWLAWHRSVPVLSSYTLRPVSSPQNWLFASWDCLGKVSVGKNRQIDISNAREFPKRFYTVFQAPDTRVWASRDDGLFEWKGGGVLLRPDIDHPAFHEAFLDIDLLPDSSLVLCPKGHGVVIWKPGSAEVTEIGPKDGLSPKIIHRLHVGADGVIWACTPGGLSKLTPLGGRRYRVDNFTVKHGLPSNTVNDVVTLGADVWVATAKGLFRMRQKPDAAPMPAPRFDRMLVNNVPYPVETRLTLPHDSANLVIQYFALHFRSGGDIPYRFRLLKPGGDTSWTLTRQRQVYFANLAPAAYRFEVQAQDEDGQWSPVSALACAIRAPWWATGWARGLFALSLGLSIFGLYRYRTGAIQKESRLKEEMLRLEGAALQAQMNPHFIFNCLNSIQFFILNNEPDAAVLYLAKFAKLVRGTLNASVAGEVSLEEEVRMLDNYLALEQLRFKQAFEYEIEVDEQLDRSKTTLPPLIVQPFVENAVLHGLKELKKDGRITVTFRSEDGLLCIRVCDNGPGLRQQAISTPADSQSHSSGITRRRLALLQLQNSQQPISVQYLVPDGGAGACVLIRLPLEEA